MILEAVLKVLFSAIGFVIGWLPDLSGLDPLSEYSDALTTFVDFLAYGFLIFPAKLFFIFIGNVMFWLGAQMVWAVVEWVYKKIPGVN